MRKGKMTIFDYLKKNCGVAIYTDEYGNTYMETDESVDLVQNVRRPYYRMRGVPVTREQAFDIIWI